MSNNKSMDGLSEDPKITAQAKDVKSEPGKGKVQTSSAATVSSSRPTIKASSAQVNVKSNHATTAATQTAPAASAAAANTRSATVQSQVDVKVQKTVEPQVKNNPEGDKVAKEPEARSEKLSEKIAGSEDVEVSEAVVETASDSSSAIPFSDEEEHAEDGEVPADEVDPKSKKKKKGWFSGDEELVQEDLDYMSSAAAAVLQQSPKGGQQLLWAICSFFVVAIVWASVAYVDEFTRGEGKVIPSSQIKIIQNLEGGIVSELFVQVGQSVIKGQELLRLDDTQFSSSLREADVTLDQLTAKTARLKAEAEGEIFAANPTPGTADLVWSQEAELFDSRRDEQKSKTRVLEQQVTQRGQELNELKARRDQHKRSLELLDSELQLTKPLVSSGAVSQVELLRLQRQVNDLAGELSGAQLAIPRANSSLQEARDKLTGAKLAFRNEARNELGDVRLELQRLSESSGALQDRVTRTSVRAPVTGTIKQVMINTIGGVIQPGMDLIEIVPTGDTLLVEAKVRPADIAFLHPGQEAIVKVTAYDFSIHGGLKGNVVNISPDTIVDEEGVSYYSVRVETENAYLGDKDKPKPIIPGMTVSVDILTGKKTVLNYILKPILKTKNLALRER